MQVQQVASNPAVPPEPSQTLVIEGASCASCVTKIEQALNSVPGVSSAEMNFADRTALVTGDVDSELLIHAVEKAGYAARTTAGISQEDSLEEKEQADRAHYRRLMLNMSIALAVGLPLMVYGLFIGEMTVTTNTQRLAWLAVGILTFGVMTFSGKHFYTGAWQSLKHHSANMDTLIALGTGTAWFYSMVVVLLPWAVPEMARHILPSNA
jgi:Cu+-exporting ATPase